MSDSQQASAAAAEPVSEVPVLSSVDEYLKLAQQAPYRFVVISRPGVAQMVFERADKYAHVVVRRASAFDPREECCRVADLPRHR